MQHRFRIDSISMPIRGEVASILVPLRRHSSVNFATRGWRSSRTAPVPLVGRARWC